MGKIAVEGLAIFELTFLWNDNFILADRVVGIVTVLRLDRTKSCGQRQGKRTFHPPAAQDG